MDRQDDEKQNDMEEEHADGGETFLQQQCAAVAECERTCRPAMHEQQPALIQQQQPALVQQQQPALIHNQQQQQQQQQQPHCTYTSTFPATLTFEFR